MPIQTYPARATETGTGVVRTATTNVSSITNLRRLGLELTEEQAKSETVQLTIAMLLDEGVHIKHLDAGVTTTFHK